MKNQLLSYLLIIVVISCSPIFEKKKRNEKKPSYWVETYQPLAYDPNEYICDFYVRINKELSRRDLSELLNDDYVLMGNSSLNDAEIIFLPEYHNDLYQLNAKFNFLYALNWGDHAALLREGSHGGRLTNLPYKKEKDKDFYWAPTIDLCALSKMAYNKLKMSENFELALSEYNTECFLEGYYEKCAIKDPFQKSLEIINSHSYIWSSWDGIVSYTGGPVDTRVCSCFSEGVPGFENWSEYPNTEDEASAYRNYHMVDRIQHALKVKEKVIVSAGASHVPEFLFLTHNQINLYNTENMKNFMQTPNIPHNTVTVIYDYIKDRKYAVVMHKRIIAERSRQAQNSENLANFKTRHI